MILNSIGSLYIFGLFNGLVYNHPSDIGLRRLTYPPAYPATTKDRYEPSTAIQQYSTGRSSVLGLADDGRVWMWESDQGFQVKPVHVDLVEHRVERVVAGRLTVRNQLGPGRLLTMSRLGSQFYVRYWTWHCLLDLGAGQ